MSEFLIASFRTLAFVGWFGGYLFILYMLAKFCGFNRLEESEDD